MSTQARYSVESLAASAVDAESGVIRDVAIMTEGDIIGAKKRVDMKSLEGLYALAKTGGIKAFINHDDMPSPTDAAGVFSGFYIDKQEGKPTKVRATFTALNAFRDHSRAAYDTLFEMAKTAPDSFGVSVSIREKTEKAGDGYALIRPVLFESADFVGTPAANKSLFSAETIVDVSEKTLQPVFTEQIQQPTTRQSVKAIYAAFSASPKKLTRAVQYMAENPAATEDVAIKVTEEEASSEELTALRASVAALTTERDQLAAKIAELTGEKEKLSATAAEVEPVKAEVAKLSAELATTKAEKDKLAVRLARYGVAPIKTDGLDRNSKPTAQTKTADEFSQLSPAEKMQFSTAGGIVV